MLNNLKTAALSIAVAALLLSTPAVASAADGYADTPGAGVDAASIRRCEVSTVLFDAGFFRAGEQVPVTISGADAEDAKVSGSTANAEGAMTASFTPPPNGAGTYSLTFAGSRSYVATIAVVPGSATGNPCGESSATAAVAHEQGLARTGGDAVSPWVLGGAAVTLVLGGALVGVGTRRRSERS